jgi:hypothetical protein
MKQMKNAKRTSFESFEAIIQSLADEREEINDIEANKIELVKKYDVRARKKNYSQRLSDALAKMIANDLRPMFPGILPDKEGRKTESKAGGGRGPKKVDVRLPGEYGMSLGISIKTISFRDHGTRRYTKNMEARDKEFRSEAADLHRYQPMAVLAGLMMLPADAATDGTKESSFDHALHVFSSRAGRRTRDDESDLFEAVFIGLYGRDEADFGTLSMYDAGLYRRGGARPPAASYSDFLERVVVEYEQRYRVSLARRWRPAPPAP